MRTLILTSVLCVCFCLTGKAGDLYSVRIDSPTSAETLRAINADVLMPVEGGYLVLADANRSEFLLQSGLNVDLLASKVRRLMLAIDRRHDRKNAQAFEVLFEEGEFRLLLVEPDRLALAEAPVEIIPLPEVDVKIEYRAPSKKRLPGLAVSTLADIYSVMDSVQQDSLESYVFRLQAFGGRLAGTDSIYAARDWIAGKFTEFGYDSVVLDQFVGAQLWDRIPCECYNVVAYKEGTECPDQQIIVGGHYDAVPGSPGADDNASGTAGVMEIARVLKDVDTRMSIIFIAFDAEESGLLGAYHYLDGVQDRDEDLVVMFNCDMIANYENSDSARLSTGDETIYAEVWDQISNANLGLSGRIGGMSASDHFPFQMAGYDVVDVFEHIFSPVYHSELDNTDHLNFDYMTRMVKATAATVFAVGQYPPPVRITSVVEPGDGHSQYVTWQELNPAAISYYRLIYYPVSAPQDVVTLDLSPSETSYNLDGLTEGEEYTLYVQAYDAAGQTSLVNDMVYFAPDLRPAAPFGIYILPLRDATDIRWCGDNTEQDFDHYAVMRDGEVIHETMDTSYVDSDASLGSELHSYRVIAVDADEYISDTLDVEPTMAKAATLQTGRILAVNRSQIYSIDFVDETETGVFMRQALDGYDFDYCSDTVAITCRTDCINLTLNDLVDYEIVIFGAETGNHEDLAATPLLHGILDTLSYYLSVGGKTVIFGRFGRLGGISEADYSTTSVTFDDAYHDDFHVERRVMTPTPWDYVSTTVSADFIGARTTISTYPHLPWDSLATVMHTTSQDAEITEVEGIPCASYVELDTSEVKVLYTYHSRHQASPYEGQPVAWQYFGPDYAYVFFDVPLSFHDRASATAALRQAVDELLADEAEPGSEPVDPIVPDELPQSFVLSQNYPNPFNPGTEIEFDLPRACKVKLEIHNIVGQRVSTLVDREMPAGSHSVSWNASGFASGMYFYRLRAGGSEISKKMVLVR